MNSLPFIPYINQAIINMQAAAETKQWLIYKLKEIGVRVLYPGVGYKFKIKGDDITIWFKRGYIGNEELARFVLNRAQISKREWKSNK